MKKFLPLMIIAIISLFAPVKSSALSPQMQNVQNELNKNCPMDLGNGLTLTKMICTDKPSLEWQIISEDMAGYHKSDVTPEAEGSFRQAFLGAFGSDNPIAQLCKSMNMDLILTVFNPEGEELLRTTFKPSDF